MLQLVGGIALVLLVALVVTAVWLAKAREQQIKSQAEANSFREGNVREDEADKVMAEPVADEFTWLRAARERVRQRDRES